MFCSNDRNDPGIKLARQVSASYAQVPCTFTVAAEGAAKNTKVEKLIGALAVAKYDLTLQTDANVRLSTTYLQNAVSEFFSSNADLLSSIVVGEGQRSIGAIFDASHLNTFIAPALCLANDVCHRACVMNKAILYRQSELDRLNAIHQIKDVFADDFILGRFYEQQGKRVVLSRTTLVENFNSNGPIKAFFARQSRWLKMNAVIDFPVFCLRVLTNPVALASFLCLIKPSLLTVLLLVTVILVKLTLDDLAFKRMGRPTIAFPGKLLSVFKDILIVFAGLYAAVSRTVLWRGVTFVIGKDSNIVLVVVPKISRDASMSPDDNNLLL